MVARCSQQARAGDRLGRVPDASLRPPSTASPASSKESEIIAATLDAVYSRLHVEETCLYKFRSHKTGLMQDLLTGKVRVKVDESEEAAP